MISFKYYEIAVNKQYIEALFDKLMKMFLAELI